MLPQTIATYLGQLGAQAPALRELARTEPGPGNSADAAEALGEATMQRIKKVGIESPRSKALGIMQTLPEEPIDVLKNPAAFAGYQRMARIDNGEHVGGRININPNAARDLIAHEMGHHISDNTKIGHMIANIRHNPKLAKALAGAVIGLPFLQSALQEGDDDAATGVALAAALSAPTLIDEGLATKNALAIMNDAGMRADLGQRGRLAGAYLSYAASPLLAGLAGNVAGNVVDDYTAVYNLGADQTEGTLMP